MNETAELLEPQVDPQAAQQPAQSKQPAAKGTTVGKSAKSAKAAAQPTRPAVEDLGPVYKKLLEKSEDPKLQPKHQLQALIAAQKLEAAHIKMRLSDKLTKQIKVRNRASIKKRTRKEQEKNFTL